MVFNSTRNIASLIVSSLALIVAVFCLYRVTANRKIAFVDINRFASSYELKKDLEKVSTTNLGRIKYVIDSLRMIQQKVLRDGVGSSVDTPLAYATSAFEQYVMRSNQDISRQVWERANPVMVRYGKEKGLQLLIGANGQGTVLYGASDVDVTEDIIEYANQEYRGRKN